MVRYGETAAIGGGIRVVLPHLEPQRRESRGSRRNSSVAPPSAASRRSVDPIPHMRVGCSLDREGNGNDREPAVAGRNTDSHSNEKIATKCDFIEKIANRSVFYRRFANCSTIGRGNFSRVFLLQKTPDSSVKFAVKEIDKERMAGRSDYVYNETQILRNCSHENICRLLEAYESPNYFFLIFEFAPFGDLFEFIKQSGIPGEPNCACVTYQIACALGYLHSKNIVHRDVKPENILIMSECWVKLTDFGLACGAAGPLYRVCGTPTYVAPEVIAEEGYGKEVDVWSLGVVLHIMLVGFAPFRAPHRSQLFRIIRRAQLSFDSPRWAQISAEAQSTVRRMLNANPRRRVTAQRLSEESWIQSFL